jgi:hypothetical protein
MIPDYEAIRNRGRRNSIGLKRWFVRQFRSSRSHAWPAREAIETVIVAVFGFGIVVVLRREGVECSLFGCGFDDDHVFAKGVPVDVVGACAGHQVLGHVVDGDGVLVVFQGSRDSRW